MRVSKKVLQSKLDSVNSLSEAVGFAPELVLNYAECYGGYCLEDETGSYRYSQRMSAREMYAYLSGMFTTMDVQSRRAFVG